MGFVGFGLPPFPGYLAKPRPCKSNFGLTVFISLILMSVAGFLMTVWILHLNAQIVGLQTEVHSLNDLSFQTFHHVERLQGELAEERESRIGTQSQIVQLQNLVVDHEKRLSK